MYGFVIFLLDYSTKAFSKAGGCLLRAANYGSINCDNNEGSASNPDLNGAFDLASFSNFTSVLKAGLIFYKVE